MTRLQPSELIELLNYSPETWHFYWKERSSKWFDSEASRVAWNNRFSGKRAFSLEGKGGYRGGNVAGTQVREHRVAWAMHYGEWPIGQIDHINKNKSDNRISNLREVSPAQNARNMKRYSTNTSGVVGVSWDGSKGLWSARIGVDGKTKNIGRFKTKMEAEKARKIKEIELGYSRNHGGRV